MGGGFGGPPPIGGPKYEKVARPKGISDLPRFVRELVGGFFKKISYALPFVHAVELERAVVAGNFDGIASHLLWVLGYSIAAFIVAVLLFLRQMRRR